MIEGYDLGDDLTFMHSFNGDYDGDCLTDLILHAKTEVATSLLFFKGDSHNNYKLVSSFVPASKIIHFTVQDISSYIVSRFRW